MPDCPRCQQVVDSNAITCPYCHTTLKAHGHPGMTLYRATGPEPLCLTCLYHADDSCTFPKRPEAMDCTLYYDRAQPIAQPRDARTAVRTWLKRNLAWLILLGLGLISLLLTLAQ